MLFKIGQCRLNYAKLLFVGISNIFKLFNIGKKTVKNTVTFVMLCLASEFPKVRKIWAEFLRILKSFKGVFGMGRVKKVCFKAYWNIFAGGIWNCFKCIAWALWYKNNFALINIKRIIRKSISWTSCGAKYKWINGKS